MARVVYSAFRLGLIHNALILLIDIPVEHKEGEVGDLILSIVKKPKPNKAQFRRGYIKRYSKRMRKSSTIYGPYKYFGVPYSVWKDMTNARGSFGSGQIFWKKYLISFYSWYKRPTIYRRKRLGQGQPQREIRE